MDMGATVGAIMDMDINADAWNTETWDAVIVGAGPAGCAAAYDLAAAGQRVLLVDRAAFPRPKACAGGLTLKAVRALRYSVAPVVRHWARSIVLEESAASAITVGRRTPVCAMTVRGELDAFCLERTRERGAKFRRVAALLAIEQTSSEVTLRFADGTTCRAHFVLGADGVHSRVRALATGGEWFTRGFALEANVPYTKPGERFPLTFDFAPVRGGYGWLFPRDTHVNVGLYIGADRSNADEENEENREKIDRAALERYIAARCGIGREHSRAVGQFLGLGAARYYPVEGTRVLLAGDAAGFVDPLTGEGIYGAIRSGQAAAMAIGKALTGMPLAAAFLSAARALQSDLRVAEHAAARFYREPALGFRLMRLPLVPRLVLRGYGEGFPLRPLLHGVRSMASVAKYLS